ncbi:hypothetical protein DM01DRAFT_1324036 [Hesseltinella vesiculosa]|uniref:Uncharacterized protein n=1 Tax=Hesseltinella vesiculosa TaxID=101127 RepID=A0A1X2GDR7_9FUNG|nr:hypothetical protein DM01DRAFT_1324036 [Hesseltinella vesiculosa]
MREIERVSIVRKKNDGKEHWIIHCICIVCHGPFYITPPREFPYKKKSAE